MVGWLAAFLFVASPTTLLAVEPPDMLAYDCKGANPCLSWRQSVAGGVPSGWRVETSNDLRTWQTSIVLQNPFPAASNALGVAVGFHSTNQFWRVCAVP